MGMTFLKNSLKKKGASNVEGAFFNSLRRNRRHGPI
jgi:hypothetical protein